MKMPLKKEDGLKKNLAPKRILPEIFFMTSHLDVALRIYARIQKRWHFQTKTIIAQLYIYCQQKNLDPPSKKNQLHFKKTCLCRNFIQRLQYPAFAAFFSLKILSLIPWLIYSSSDQECLIQKVFWAPKSILLRGLDVWFGHF